MSSTYAFYLSAIPTMEKCSSRNSVVLVRIDINSPIDPTSSRLLDDYRLESHAETIRELSNAGSKVVVLAHQGRPGQEDFTSLELHLPYLEKYVGRTINFIDDVAGPAAREAIKSLKPGEILLLNNVRLLSEEVIERRIELQSKTYLVSRLAPCANYFVFDAFATAHRSQPSVVGFPLLLPSCLGRVMQRELNALAKLEGMRGEGVVLIAGGAKVQETIRAVESVLSRNLAEYVLVGGLTGVTFVIGKYGKLSAGLRKYAEDMGLLPHVDRARALLEKFKERLILPIDFGVLVNNSRVDVDVLSANGPVYDIGGGTERLFLDYMRSAKAIIFSGPLGYIEDERFSRGTMNLMRYAVEMGKYVVIGGGHTVAVARRMGIMGRIGHVSTGGRAFIQALGGEEMPALQALLISSKKFWGMGYG